MSEAFFSDSGVHQVLFIFFQKAHYDSIPDFSCYNSFQTETFGISFFSFRKLNHSYIVRGLI